MARIPYLELSGGMQRRTSSLIQQDNEAVLILNMHGDKIGARTKRLGYSQVGDTLQSGKDILGHHGFYQKNGTDLQLATVNNSGDTQSVLKYNNSGTWTNITGATTLPAGVKSEFATFIDYTFIVGGRTMTTGSLTGTTYSTTTNVTNAPKAKYVGVYQDRLILFNCDVSGTARPSRFYFSSIPSGTPLAITFNVTEGTGDYVAVNEDDGEEIMGFIVSRQRLYIWKETTMWYYDGSTVQKIADVGCASHRTIKERSGIIFWMDMDGQLWAFGGGQPKKISGKIDDISVSLTAAQKSGAFAEIDFDHYKCFVGNLTIDGISYSNCEINYKISANDFVIYQYANTFTVYDNYVSSGVRRVYAGASNGEVFKLAETGDSVYSDDGSPIQVLYVSKPYDLGFPEQKKYVSKVYAISSAPVGLKAGIRMDGKPITQQSILKNEPLNVSSASKYFNLIATENSSDEPCVLEGFVVETVKDTNK